MTMKSDAKLKRNWLVSSKLTWGIWWILTSALGNLKKLHFHGLLLTKVFNVWALKRSYVWWHWILMQNLKENWLLLSKMTWGIWEIFTRALESLKIGTLMGFFCPKLKMYELKIYRGVMCHDNEEWCKNWRGIDLSVQNWHEEFDEFWPEHSKISKICTLMGCFWPKYIMFELKKYRGVMFDGTEYWCKIWRETDFTFKNDMRNLANFHQNKFECLKIGT